MPNKTVYIRNDDLEAWEAIQDKPEFMHQAIQSTVPYGGKLPFVTMPISKEVAEAEPPKLVQPMEAIVLKDNEQVKGRIQDLPNKKGREFCKHGAAKGLCKMGCK